MHDLLHVLSALSQQQATVRAERDVADPAELSDQLAKLAVEQRDKHGEYERYRLLIDAADALEVMGSDLAEARDDIQRLLGQVRDLMEQLAMYRVVEVVPATRETPAEYATKRRPDDSDAH
jgi:hypothetical protein